VKARCPSCGSVTEAEFGVRYRCRCGVTLRVPPAEAVVDWSGSAGEEAATSPVPLDVLGLRLRHAWVRMIGPWLESTGADLGEDWRNTGIQFTRTAITLGTPLDFGDGDPFEKGVHGELLSRFQECSPDLHQLGWTYVDPAARRSWGRRGLLTAFSPGDPDWPATVDAASELSRRLLPLVAPPCTPVFTDLALAGMTSTQFWFVTRREDGKRLVGATPGAGYALFEAVRQGSRRKVTHAVVEDTGWSWPIDSLL
jgi:hypothetical protein